MQKYRIDITLYLRFGYKKDTIWQNITALITILADKIWFFYYHLQKTSNFLK
jgi:hypothetical protein